MKRQAFAIALLLACAAPRAATAGDEPPGVVDYRVVAGDTCAAIATRFYGDPRRIDLIHEANPRLGPPPHALRPGQILRLPPKPGAAPTGPDASVSRVRNDVEIRAPEPRPARPNDALFRGNRVATKEESQADITFRDETQIKMSENTIVVIVGDVRSAAVRVGAAETTLVTGSLRARLADLSGKPRPQVSTESAAVALGGGEALVSHDAKKTTRLAVHRGESSLSAQRQSVSVRDGFGSKAPLGSPPTPPAPLPDAPAWTSPERAVVLAEGAAVDLSFSFDRGAGGPAPAAWHVVLARDEAFEDVIVDTRAPLEIRRLETKGVGPGTYFARVSAIDADDFEGKWSAPAKRAVVTASLAGSGARTSRLRVAPETARCELDGAPVSGDVVLAREVAHALACHLDDGASTERVVIPALPLGQVRATADAHWDARARAGVVRVRLVDGQGRPVDGVPVVALDRAGASVGAFVRRDAGLYEAPFTFAGDAAPPAAIRLRVRHDAIVETNPVALGPAPSSPGAALELGLAAGASVRDVEQAGLGFAAGARLAMPLGPGAALVGLGVTFDKLLPARVDVEGAEGSTATARALGTSVAIGLPIGYRLGARGARLLPYVTIAPELTRQLLTADVADERLTGKSWLAGARGGVGLEIRVGGGAIFAEGGGRLAGAIDTGRISVGGSGLTAFAGYRFSP